MAGRSVTRRPNGARPYRVVRRSKAAKRDRLTSLKTRELIRVSTTMPATGTIPRIATVARLLDESARLDVSTVIGLDVDLVTGHEYKIADDLSDADHTAALLAAFGDEAARVAALADMIATGFVNVPRAYGRLLVLADELERADGYELDEADEVFAGWAA